MLNLGKESTIEIAAQFEPLFQPCRYKIMWGGRGGAKSWAIAQALLILAAREKKLILCTREFQGSIQESVHRLLVKMIDRMGMNGFYDIQKTIIRGANGSEVIFEGLKNNVTKIKGMEDIDIVWAEEAENISEGSWEVLIPTIRKANSEIWVSFNPFQEVDATYRRFVTNPPPEYIKTKSGKTKLNYIGIPVSYRDNPWFPEELQREMEHCRKMDYGKYLHIWEGQCRSDAELQLIPTEWIKAAMARWTPSPPVHVPMCAIGVDVAQVHDNIVISPRHGGWFAPLIVIPGSTMPTGKDVAGAVIAARRDQALITIDMGGGYGGSAYEQLADNLGPEHLYGYKGSEGTTGKTANGNLAFANRRAEAYYRLYEALDPSQAGGSQIQFPPDDNLLEDLISIRQAASDHHIIKLEAKDKMIARLGRSTDSGDSVVMSWYKGLQTRNIQGGWGSRNIRPVVVMKSAQRRRYG